MRKAGAGGGALQFKTGVKSFTPLSMPPVILADDHRGLCICNFYQQSVERQRLHYPYGQHVEISGRKELLHQIAAQCIATQIGKLLITEFFTWRWELRDRQV
jgi:hypothetical protein